MVDPVLDKEAKQKLKKIYKNYTDILTKYRYDIINTHKGHGAARCPIDEKFIEDVKNNTDSISNYVYPFLNWIKSENRTHLINDIKKIQEELKQIDNQIGSEQKYESISSQKIFNNKQINLNIQNKLIYLIRYKFNLFISIIIIIILMCSYLYIIPRLKISFSN